MNNLKYLTITLFAFITNILKSMKTSKRVYLRNSNIEYDKLLFSLTTKNSFNKILYLEESDFFIGRNVLKYFATIKILCDQDTKSLINSKVTRKWSFKDYYRVDCIIAEDNSYNTKDFEYVDLNRCLISEFYQLNSALINSNRGYHLRLLMLSQTIIFTNSGYSGFFQNSYLLKLAKHLELDLKNNSNIIDNWLRNEIHFPMIEHLTYISRTNKFVRTRYLVDQYNQIKKNEIMLLLVITTTIPSNEHYQALQTTLRTYGYEFLNGFELNEKQRKLALDLTRGGNWNSLGPPLCIYMFKTKLVIMRNSKFNFVKSKHPGVEDYRLNDIKKELRKKNIISFHTTDNTLQVIEIVKKINLG